jgi:rsbT co-antagonist protein RsbR
MLQAVRAETARAVVLDLTGAVALNASIVRRLLETVAAARLLGAAVIATGISSTLARGLVAMGEQSTGLRTAVDLQAGIHEAERLLAATTAGSA